MDNKLIVFAVAAIMVMVGCAVSIDNESDAAVANNDGKFNVYSINMTADNPSWVIDENVSAYDGCQAIERSGTTVFTESSIAVKAPTDTSTTPTYNNSQKIGIYSETYNYTYYYPNPEYGDFSSYDGVANTEVNEWTVFIHDGSNWVKAAASAGWYKPFADYSVVKDAAGNSCSTANLALVYGANITSVPTSISDAITSAPLETVVTQATMNNNANYEYHFTLSSNVAVTVANNTFVKELFEGEVVEGTELTSDLIEDKITVIGYGSDANLALVNAIGSNNVSFQNIAPSVTVNGVVNYYGWYSSIFGMSDSFDSASNTWHYWNTMYEGAQSTMKYCDFSLSYYSNFTDGYNYATNTFELNYV